ncbi:hypothetical protein GW765_03790 [Candidatus Parcubacteria bacterium]|nr:hypothetical protein [Candidatus Parcubacteria bacterium]
MRGLKKTKAGIKQEKEAVLAIEISQWEVSTRAYRILKYYLGRSISEPVEVTIRHLLGFKKSEFLRMHNFGIKSMKELEEFLLKYELHLEMSNREITEWLER